jgi:hypothetical protein
VAITKPSVGSTGWNTQVDALIDFVNALAPSAVVPISADKVSDGTTNHVFTAADDTKLAGIAAGATVYTNSDADARITAQLITGRGRGQVPLSGAYLTAQLVSTGTTAPGAGTLRAMPLDLAASATLDRIGVEVTTAAASTTAELAIYNHDATTDRPGTLLLDAGSIDTSTTGFKELTISQTLAAGRWWLASLPLGGAATFRSNANLAAGFNLITPLTQAELNGNAAGALVSAGRTGLSALPTPFAYTATSDRAPRVYVRCA